MPFELPLGQVCCFGVGAWRVSRDMRNAGLLNEATGTALLVYNLQSLPSIFLLYLECF